MILFICYSQPLMMITSINQLIWGYEVNKVFDKICRDIQVDRMVRSGVDGKLSGWSSI